jgi:hypothetical protein
VITSVTDAIVGAGGTMLMCGIVALSSVFVTGCIAKGSDALGIIYII